MNSTTLKILAVTAALSFGPAVLAQQSGSGVSGVSGVSGGLGIDFAASQGPGANQEKEGGFANAIDEAMGDKPTPNADCGKLKCD